MPRISIIVLFLMFLSSCHSITENIYEVKFGYLTTADGKRFSFSKESNIVPLIPMSKGIYYGVEILPYDDLEHSVEMTVHLPNGSSMDLPPYSVKNKTVIPMGFDKNDPEGEYRLEIIIDQSHYHSIKFEAVSPKNVLLYQEKN